MIKFPTGVRVMFVCGTYIYAGTVDGADHENVQLSDAVIVYDTGRMTQPHWNEAEPLGKWNIPVKSIESWGACAKTIKQDETKKHD